MAAPSSHHGDALGLLETFGLIAAIEGADAMLKAADVRLIAQERTVPGLITNTIIGETAAVRAAIDAGRAAAERVGQVVSAHVIPRPDGDVWTLLGRTTVRASDDEAAKASAPDGYEAMTVSELRSLAREQATEAFSGRTISRAPKQQLVHFLRTGEV